MARALVIYTTKTGNTRAIAESIADGLREAGIEVIVIDANNAITGLDFSGYDAYLFGSPTHHGEMTRALKDLLFLIDGTNLEGKVGGSFGAYGWSGEAPIRIYDTMKNLYKMEMVASPLRIQIPVAAEHLKKISNAYGKEVGGKIKVSSSISEERVGRSK